MEHRDFLTADTIFLNGKVLTVNKDDEVVRAVAVRGNKIIYVGTNEGALALKGSHTQTVDVKDKTVMPGFIDAHMHFLLFGLLGKGVVNVEYSYARSIAEIKNLIRLDAESKKDGEWIKLQGYDHNKLEEGRHPTKEELDEAAPNNPVQCTRCCAHMGVYNTKALGIGGVKSPDQFAPGEVVVDKNGELTGLLKETAHMYMSTKVEFTDEECLAGLKNANDIMLSLGITTVHDAGAYGAITTKNMQNASASGLLDIRISPMIFDMYGKESNVEYVEHFIKTGIHTCCGDEKFRVGPVKIMTDGSSSGPSCATKEPYSHDANLKGILVWQQEEVDEIFMKSHKAGFQVTAHAVGDKAVEIVVNAIDKAVTAYPRMDCRHRIEHCGLTNPALIDKISKLGIVPISNPSFITINAKDYNRFYGDRVNYMFALKSYMDKGIITAIGSDAPVTHPDPMNGLYGALNRKDRNSGDVAGKGQTVSVSDIVRMFTYNGAYASFEENIKGSLEVGKLADIIVLSEDILTYPKEEISNVTVEYTMIDGKILYRRSM